MKNLLLILSLLTSYSCSKESDSVINYKDTGAPKLIKKEPHYISNIRQEIKELELDEKTQIPKVILKDINNMNYENKAVKQVLIDDVKRSMFYLNTKDKKTYKENKKKYYSYKACEYIDMIDSLKTSEKKVAFFSEKSEKRNNLKFSNENAYKIFKYQLYLDGNLIEDYVSKDIYETYKDHCIR